MTLHLVERATVKLTKCGGQGAIVTGGYIVTAAHCVEHSADGSLVLGDVFPQDVETADGRRFKAEIAAIELVKDIAVLTALDGQDFPDDAEAYDDAVGQIPAVPIAADENGIGKGFEVFIRTHKGKWLAAKATQFQPRASTLCVECDEQIEGGTSGGPIVTNDGALVAIVSNSSDTGGKCAGSMPRPHLALPAWLVAELL